MNHPERVKAFHQKHNARTETKERKLQWARENRDHINERRRQKYREHVEATKEVDSSKTNEQIAYSLADVITSPETV